MFLQIAKIRSRSASASSSSPKRIESLDGLRALAIVLVLAFHMRESGAFAHAWINAVAAKGQFGVEIFFVLSGFLITMLLLREEQKHGRIDLKMFYIRRGFRILPPAMTYLLVVAVLAIVGVSTASGDLATSALFVRNFFSWGSTDTGHFWTLAIEEQFYLLWPLALVVLP
ncbi:MAG: acyltransferase, partial [Phycisphaerae bacterium]|nr:acyltransferase [Phycisphaerae bacterium]